MTRLKWKKSYWVYLSIVATAALLTWVFMTPEVTDTCSDELLGCLDQAHSLFFWAKSKEAFICLYRNVVCVFSNIPILF